MALLASLMSTEKVQKKEERKKRKMKENHPHCSSRISRKKGSEF
jgi:hypothetical protein